MDASEIKARQEEFKENLQTKFAVDEIGTWAVPPPVLFHYTSGTGLKGIIENDVIWATNYRYVNDLSEFLYANELLQDEIKRRMSRESLLVQAVFHAVLETPDMLLGVVDIFVACFCEEGDLLSQWRTYGGQGGGYAIGYKDVGIRSAMAGTRYSLSKIIYDELRQRQLVQYMVDKLCAAIDDLGDGIVPSDIKSPAIYAKADDNGVSIKSGLPEPLGELCWIMTSAFWRLACCFKSPAFAVEKEWRFVYTGFNRPEAAHYDLKFRTSGATLIPYIELPLFTSNFPHASSGSNMTLEKIIYGPGLNSQISERSISYLTAKFRPSVSAESSKIRVKV